MSAWPKEIEKLIQSTFGNGSKAYGQISTLDEKGQPTVRTVHIHCIEQPIPSLVVSCNIKSDKWQNLKKNSKIAGCYWNPENQTQIRFEGIADLISEKNHDFKDLIQTMWLKMRSEVRLAYLLDEQKIPLDTKNPKVDPEQHSKNHGILLITPTVWDVFENNPNSYRLGKRTIYQLQKTEWSQKDVNSLYSN